MKFIVRGKSVDFKNREGSSPSIPNKRFDPLSTYFSNFFIFSGSTLVMFLSHSTLSQMDRIVGEKFLSYHKSFDLDINIYTNQHL